jgi:hypothetical protein
MRPLALLCALAGLVAAPLAAQARVDIRIDLGSQTMHVTAPDGTQHRWAISSGRSGFRTPTGVYSSKRLARMHYSAKYDDAPMPHSIFFSGGYAIHGTGAVGMLGRPASHGCIRLAPGNAARLFAMVQRSGARIAISGAAPAGDGRAFAQRRGRPRIASIDDDEPAFAARPRGRGLGPGFYDAPILWRIDGPAPGWRLR